MVNRSQEKKESALRDVGPSFVTYQVELVANKGVVSKARFVSVSEPCELLDAKSYRKPSMWIAGFVSWYESFCFNGVFSMEKAIIGAIEKVILSKENVKAEDICAICRKEFPYMEVSSYEEWLVWILSLRLSIKHKRIFEGVCYVTW
ncbi:hypothetical protein Tco_0959888 [Tanacetum coccineum]